MDDSDCQGRLLRSKLTGYLPWTSAVKQRCKSSSKFVKKEDLPAVRKQLKNYARMKLLMQRWIDLATGLSTLRLIKDTG